MAKAQGFNDPQPGYWESYSNLQRVKHELVRRYLGGWYAKLGYTARRVNYIDTHAGRGEHVTGHEGSPIVALETLVTHQHVNQLTASCEFKFVFLEKDAGNAQALRDRVSRLGPLPANVTCEVVSQDYAPALKDVIGSLRGADLSPSFVFLDPYTFLLPGSLLRELLTFKRVELFINVMWRELDLAIQNELRQATPTAQSNNLDAVFDGLDWRTEFDPLHADHTSRALRACEMYREVTHALWQTHLLMLGKNGATRYALLHLTNHDAGRDLMKDCLWRICPDGVFTAGQNTDPNQQVLISPEPDLRPLEHWLVTRLESSPARWRTLNAELRQRLFLPKHLWLVVRGLRKEGRIIASSFSGNFSQKANPLLSLNESGN